MKEAERDRHPRMEVGIAGLSDGDLAFAFDCRSHELGLDQEVFFGNVTVDGVLRKVSAQLTLDAVVRADRRRSCDRCLAEDAVLIVQPLTLYFHMEAGGDAYRDTGTGYRTLDPKQASIVLDDDVRSLLILSLPMKDLCRDDCRGLCARCGADLNNGECACVNASVDPRWEKLTGLLPPDE